MLPPNRSLCWPAPALACRSGGSLVAEFDLVCSRRWVLYLQTSAFFIAVLLGCVLWQAGSERYGERACWGAAKLCNQPPGQLLPVGSAAAAASTTALVL